MAKIPIASRVLNHARPKTVAPFKDEQIIAHCEQCDMPRRLSDCRQEETETERYYRSSGCGERLVIIRSPNEGGVPVPDSGYRLGKWVFANAVDVRIEGFDRLLFPANWNATTVDIRIEQSRDTDGAEG